MGGEESRDRIVQFHHRHLGEYAGFSLSVIEKTHIAAPCGQWGWFVQASLSPYALIIKNGEETIAIDMLGEPVELLELQEQTSLKALLG